MRILQRRVWKCRCSMSQMVTYIFFEDIAIKRSVLRTKELNRKDFQLLQRTVAALLVLLRIDTFSFDYFSFIVSFQFSHNFTSSNSTFWGARTRDPTSSRDNTIGHKRKSNWKIPPFQSGRIVSVGLAFIENRVNVMQCNVGFYPNITVQNYFCILISK